MLLCLSIVTTGKIKKNFALKKKKDKFKYFQSFPIKKINKGAGTS
jgi:hypothetical protein